MEPEKHNLLIPVAIVLAGVLVAGAFFMSRNNSEDTNNQNNQEQKVVIEPVKADDHILGNPNADIVIIDYSDLECPFCKDFHNVMHQIMDEFGKEGRVSWVFRHFPLTQLHSKAPKEAEATECAGELGGEEVWWAYTDKIYEITPSNNRLDLDKLPEIAKELGLDVTKFEECLESGRHGSKVKASYDSAVKAGASGTPYLIFLVKGEEPIPVSGSVPYDDLKNLLEQTLLTLDQKVVQ
jgi:protein-disulfide isomerase